MRPLAADTAMEGRAEAVKYFFPLSRHHLISLSFRGNV